MSRIDFAMIAALNTERLYVIVPTNQHMVVPAHR